MMFSFSLPEDTDLTLSSQHTSPPSSDLELLSSHQISIKTVTQNEPQEGCTRHYPSPTKAAPMWIQQHFLKRITMGPAVTCFQ